MLTARGLGLGSEARSELGAVLRRSPAWALGIAQPHRSRRAELKPSTAPNWEGPLGKLLGRRFDVVAVLPHPFFRLPHTLHPGRIVEAGHERPNAYPDAQLVRSHAEPVLWRDVATAMHVDSLSAVHIALLTAIGAVRRAIGSPQAAEALSRAVEVENLWRPTEGRIEPLLLPILSRLALEAGVSRLQFHPELESTAAEFTANRLAAEFDPDATAAGCLASEGGEVAFCVHWDSFYTVAMGPKSWLRRDGALAGAEHFLVEQGTRLLW